MTIPVRISLAFYVSHSSYTPIIFFTGDWKHFLSCYNSFKAFYCCFSLLTFYVKMHLYLSHYKCSISSDMQSLCGIWQGINSVSSLSNFSSPNKPLKSIFLFARLEYLYISSLLRFSLTVHTFVSSTWSLSASVLSTQPPYLFATIITLFIVLQVRISNNMLFTHLTSMPDS